MARAKNTQRSEARRRYRGEVRANTLTTDAYLDGGDRVDEPVRMSSPQPELAPAPPVGIRSMFSRPDVRGDLRALPQLLLTQKRLWIPFALLLIGFAIDAAFFWGALPLDTQSIAILVFTLILSPQALFVPFIAGFLAPRGAYLMGALIGLLDAILVAILFDGPVAADRNANILGGTGIGDIVAIFIVAIIFSTFAAAFASWYRRFLRQSQDRARANRALRDQQAAAKRKEDERKARLAEREARRTASTRKLIP